MSPVFLRSATCRLELFQIPSRTNPNCRPSSSLLQTDIWSGVLPFRCLGCVLQVAVFTHTPVHHTLRWLLLFLHLLLSQCTKLHLKHGLKTTYILALLIAKSKDTPPAGRLQRAPPGAPWAGPPHQPGGGQGSRRSRDHQCTGWVQCSGVRPSQL